MSLPYFPLYPKDFEAKTSHLTLEEDGAYNRLLRLCWLTPGCSLPDDPAWIARRLRVDAATYDRLVAPLISEFFKRTKGRVWNHTKLATQARAAVAQGAVATVIRLSPTTLRHHMRFHPEGWWEQTGGLFGASDRRDPVFRAWRFAARITREVSLWAKLRPE